MRRRTMLAALAAATATPLVASACDSQEDKGSESGTSDTLRFDPEKFTTETATVTTADGERKITYRQYKGIVYVAKPVDEQYQSLNVKVPVEIDGAAVDASKAPILLSNNIAGYLSGSVTGTGGMPGGLPSGATPPSGTAPGGPGGFDDGGNRTSNPDLALAAGYVVVEAGARGRDLVAADGVYYGVAPAAIVDLKAAVRYLRHNSGRVPGNTDWIVSTGVSAGGAMSALLGASGDSDRYDSYLTDIGAADASDAIFASADYCPIADLEHADMAYEWNWGGNPLQSGEQVDRTVSRELAGAFPAYQASLNLRGRDGSALTADNYGEHLLRTYLQPSATEYLKALPDSDRDSYLAANPWLRFDNGTATFTWADYLTHVGARKKNVPAFDAFDLSSGENNEFGNGTTKARHFTLYSLRHATGEANAQLDSDLPGKLELMNPMYFLDNQTPGRAEHWWIRVGTKDSDTSLTVVGNLAAKLENLGANVDAAMYWDAGHGSNEDAADFITWIRGITGYGR
ncbi:subtype B tannase [Nocardia sp. NPDC019304]|uniref:subtype B tannase n=1 Tax=unclassified Nocardia TaxID=2637762 RepID=UPI0033F3250A